MTAQAMTVDVTADQVKQAFVNMLNARDTLAKAKKGTGEFAQLYFTYNNGRNAIKNALKNYPGLVNNYQELAEQAKKDVYTYFTKHNSKVAQSAANKVYKKIVEVGGKAKERKKVFKITEPTSVKNVVNSGIQFFEGWFAIVNVPPYSTDRIATKNMKTVLKEYVEEGGSKEALEAVIKNLNPKAQQKLQEMIDKRFVEFKEIPLSKTFEIKFLNYLMKKNPPAAEQQLLKAVEQQLLKLLKAAE